VKLIIALAKQVSLCWMSNGILGKIVRSTGSWSTVRLSDGSFVECRLRGQFRKQGMRSTNPVAVGDNVSIEMEDEKGVITEIHDRTNYIIRKSVNLSKEVHVIAANMDQAIVVATVAKPRTSYGFIDRFLCVAEAYGIKATVVLNKTDLTDSDKLRRLTAEYINTYTNAGYSIIQTSAVSEFGINNLKELLKDKTTLVFGHSGVGKSSLLNTLQPGLELRTGDISEVHSKGTHTTTFAEMFELDFGGFVIDTPGVKEFGMVDMTKEELYHYFPDIFNTSDQCKFGNCLHVNEPGCAVKRAVESVEISESRYSSYISILESL
jgi:ribosome biogenesis GTPase